MTGREVEAALKLGAENLQKMALRELEKPEDLYHSDTLETKKLMSLENRDDPDQIVEPEHYTRFVVEPVNFILKNHLSFWQGSVIKYIMRCGHKVNQGETATEAELRDLGKAARYIEMRINHLRGKEPNDTTK